MKYQKVGNFVGKLVLFLVILLITDRLLGWAVGRLYFKQAKGVYARTTYSIDSAKQDVLIFGSSRANHHYSPSLITEGTSLSCYNLGQDAESIPYYTALEEVVLGRCRPKLVIVDVHPFELSSDNSKYVKLSILLPYCIRHPELVKYIEQISTFEKYKLLAHTYPYNSSLFIMCKNLFLSGGVPNDDHGYQPFDQKLNNESLKSIVTYETKRTGTNDVLDTTAVNYYRQFLDRTKKLNIRTLVVISPTLLKMKESLSIKTLKEVCKEYENCIFLDYSQDSHYNYQPDLFVDMFHLNRTGSEIFSRELASYLKKEKLLPEQKGLAVR